MSVKMGNLTRFIIEQDDMCFDISGYITDYSIGTDIDVIDFGLDQFAGLVESTLTINIVGAPVITTANAEDFKIKDIKEPLDDYNHVPGIRRCGYCRQLNDKDQLFCGHCGGEL